MWAYYGDNYKGYCIGYDPSEIWKVRPCQLGAVNYLSGPVEFSFIDADKAMGQFVDYFTKKIKWQHENEYRYITFFEPNESRLMRLNKTAVKQVYVGNSMHKNDLQQIIDCLKSLFHSSVKLFKVIDGANFDLVAEEIRY